MTLLNRLPAAHRWPLFAGLASLAILMGAYVFQYGFGYPPCPLCYEQRHVHMVAIVLGFGAGALMFWRPALAKFGVLACLALAAVFAWSAGLAGWHAGIEYGFWEGPQGCAVAAGGAVSQADLDAILGGGARVVRCDEVPWSLFGISMAGYNALLSAALAVLSVLAALRRPQ